MSAGDGVLDAAAITELRDRHYGEGSIPEHHSAHPCDACRLLLTFASRPATDPAGLDELRASMEAFAAAREADVRANRDAPDNINEIVAAAIRGWLARLSVADGPGPEERP